MKNFYLLLIACAYVQSLSAQLTVGAAFNLQPGLATYNLQSGTPAKGISLMTMYRCSQSPFSFGMEIGQSIYNDESFGMTYTDPEFGLVAADFNEKDMLTQFHVFTRYHFTGEAVLEPYAEGRIGTISSYTTRKVSEGTSVESGEVVMSQKDIREEYPCFDYRRTGIQAGVGLGTVINLKRLVCATEEDFGFGIKLDTGVTYYLGTNTGFSGQSGEVDHPVSTPGAINSLNWHVGLLLAFD